MRLNTKPSSESRLYRIDVDWEKATFNNYRDMVALKLVENHDHLEKLIWDMQDALDELVSESQKQVDCLDGIEDLFGTLRKRVVEKVEEQTKEIGGKSKDMDVVLDTEQLVPVTLPVDLRPSTSEKGCQCSQFVDDAFNLSLMESRHCQYMFEAFHNLQFVLEIISPFEIERPSLSKAMPLSNSKSHAEHRLRLRGTITDLNSQLVDICLQPKPRNGVLPVPKPKTQKSYSKPVSPLGYRISAATTPVPSQPRYGVKSLTQVKSIKDFAISQRKGSMIGPSPGESIQLNINLRLVTVDPFTLQQTRPLPQFFQASTKVKYAEIEHIQAIMPEVADIRFNLNDLLHPEMTPDQFYVNNYFVQGKKDLSEAAMLKVEEDVTISLNLYRFLLRHRNYFRLTFLSYNMEAMSSVNDMLSMEFPTFVKLLKDSFMISPGFDLLAAAKVFYLSCIKSKELPESSEPDGERKWFKHLLNSYNFKKNYRLKLSGFIEALVRLTFYHPRFQKLTNLRPHEKVTLFYTRCLKPNARLTQGSLYSSLLKDVHVIDVLSQFEPLLYDIFLGYTTHLTVTERLVDFVGKDKKMDLHKYYSFLSNAGILIEAEIVSVGNDDIEEEIDKLNELQLSDTARTKKEGPEIRSNQASEARVKETTIRFPSSMLEKVENNHIKLKASKNVRQTGSVRDMILLPFFRPIRSEFQIDKLTAFNFFVAGMKSIDTIYLLDPHTLGDGDFCIDFKEFVDLMGMLGILYWKTTARCLDLSLVEGLVTFVRSVIEKLKYMREFHGLTPSEKENISKQLLKQRLGPMKEIQTKPIITKTMIPQERFVQRRESI